MTNQEAGAALPIVERLRETVVIGYHSDGYAGVGSDGHYESRPATPMTRLANRDGPEAADTIEELVEALKRVRNFVPFSCGPEIDALLAKLEGDAS
jgi:hypothetical protein